MNEFAKILCDIGAVKIQPGNPYTFTSGWKSPIYIDCRMIISFPEQRDRVVEAMCDQVKQFAQTSKSDFITGGETAGIPLRSVYRGSPKVTDDLCEEESERIWTEILDRGNNECRMERGTC